MGMWHKVPLAWLVLIGLFFASKESTTIRELRVGLEETRTPVNTTATVAADLAVLENARKRLNQESAAIEKQKSDMEKERTILQEERAALEKEKAALAAAKEKMAAESAAKVELKETPKESTLSVDAPVLIPINNNSTIASDIISIQHIPNQNQVLVNLKPEARCPHPFLVGRLSGQALVDLKWTWSSNSKDGGTDMTGIYDTFIPGDYYLEIIIIHCQDFTAEMGSALKTVRELIKSPDQMKQAPSKNASSNPLLYNFVSACVEDANNRSVTALNASITVKPLAGTNSNVAAALGLWTLTNNTADARKPLYTFAQPPDCMPSIKKKIYSDKRCFPDNTALLPYGTFQVNPSPDPHQQQRVELLDQLNGDQGAKLLQQPTKTKVCYMGASHARSFLEAGEELGFAKYNVSLEHLDIRYPFHRHPDGMALEKMKDKHCDKLVIGIVQWPASFYGVARYTHYAKYYQELMAMLETIQSKAVGFRGDMFFRTVHRNPLTTRCNMCPMKDSRNPTAMKGYQMVVQQFALDHNIPFLDSEFISYPAWDAPHDFSHLAPLQRNLEALYVTALALGVVTAETNVLMS